MRILEKPGLTFDDVLLVPRKGYVNRRFTEGNKIDIGIQLTPNTYKISFPILSANMDTVTGREMARVINMLGGLGIVHRFMPIEEHRKILNYEGQIIGCIGVTESERERFLAIKDKVSAVLIDTAHGHSQLMVNQIQWIKEQYHNIDIIAGNVCTADAALALIRAGADCVKVGVGPGSMCTTRIQTGCGVPQLTAIMEVKQGIEKVHSQQRNKPWRPRIIADGGIRNSGDIVKALAAGADAVMIGSLFAATNEAPGKLRNSNEGTKDLHQYRGMASRDFQEEWKGEAHSVEGESVWIRSRGSVVPIFEALLEGIISGMSYQGADNLEDLYDNAEFIQITSAGYIESTPHGLQ